MSHYHKFNYSSECICYSVNFLLIVLDSVRASNTSLHGYERETTPFLESLSMESKTYSQARSPSRWSVPSHASMFTGLHTPEHGVDKVGKQLLGGQTIWEWLSQQGHDTGVFSRNAFLTLDDTGLDRGFDRVESLSDPPFAGANPQTVDSIVEFIKSGYSHPIGTSLNGIINKLAWDKPELLPRSIRNLSPRLKTDRPFVDAALDWISSRREEEWAACVNLMDAHGPRTPRKHRWSTSEAERVDREARTPWDYTEGIRPWSELSAVENLYDDTLRDVDASVERLIEELRSMNQLEKTLVIVTSDHGEGFGEPDPLRESRICGHIAGTHEALFHVPLLVRTPNNKPDTINTPVSLTELPSIVRKAITGEKAQFGNKPVWAFDIGEIPGRGIPSDINRNKYKCYLSDATLQYEPGSDCDVLKTGYFKDRTVQFQINSTEVIGRSSTEETLTKQFTDQGIAAVSEDNEVNGEVEEHLEHLGYL